MTGVWGPDEKDRFAEGVRIYGKDFEKITEHVGTRSLSQVRNYCRPFKQNEVLTHPDLIAILEGPPYRGAGVKAKRAFSDIVVEESGKSDYQPDSQLE